MHSILCGERSGSTTTLPPMTAALPSQRLAALTRTLRKAQGLSQEALAERAGLHRNFISLIERGQNQPTVDTLFRLAEALGLTAVELVERISTPSDAD